MVLVQDQHQPLGGYILRHVTSADFASSAFTRSSMRLSRSQRNKGSLPPVVVERQPPPPSKFLATKLGRSQRTRTNSCFRYSKSPFLRLQLLSSPIGVSNPKGGTRSYKRLLYFQARRSLADSNRNIRPEGRYHLTRTEVYFLPPPPRCPPFSRPLDPPPHRPSSPSLSPRPPERELSI